MISLYTLKSTFRILIAVLISSLVVPALGSTPKMPPAAELDLQVAFEVNLGQPVGQVRTCPLVLPGNQRGFLVAYAEDFDVDPWVQMFFYPKDTTKLAVITEDGEVLWRRDLGPGIPPGHWFCPVLAFDLDGDEIEEIWCITNPDTEHPLGIRKYRLTRFDAVTGEETGSWPWPQPDRHQSLSHLFRNFIKGAHVDGKPVLITAQGTYGPMSFQAWNPDMSQRWTRHIRAEDPGARGSHMVPFVDMDGDGSAEMLWGERLIDLRSGKDIWCADAEVYSGHSDSIHPFNDPEEGGWSLFTCRENDSEASPRVVVFNDKGERIWGAVDKGHMDIGWVAHLRNRKEFIALAIRIGRKSLGRDGRHHHGVEEFTFNAKTGQPVDLGFDLYGLRPLDLTGDGIQELVAYRKERAGSVLDGWGRVLGKFEGKSCFTGKFLERPGEQLLTFTPDGTLRLYCNANAHDTETALKRYADPYYKANLQNCRSVLGGL